MILVTGRLALLWIILEKDLYWIPSGERMNSVFEAPSAILLFQPAGSEFPPSPQDFLVEPSMISQLWW